MAIIKFLLEGLLLIMALSLGAMFLPAIIGIVIGIMKFQSGKFLGGVIAVIIGVACQALLLFMVFGFPDIGMAYEDEECPNCGSSDTDGNHCHDCGDDF